MKYGVENISQTSKWKDNIKSKQEDILRKIYQTKRRNNSFHISRPENRIYTMLLEIFPRVIRQYKSERYPWNCDFYVPEKDLFVECNFHWTHGFGPYDPNNQAHQEKIQIWRAKKSKYYNNAVCTWTVRDIEKRELGKNLNWLEFFSEQEFMNWFINPK